MKCLVNKVYTQCIVSGGVAVLNLDDVVYGNALICCERTRAGTCWCIQVDGRVSLTCHPVDAIDAQYPSRTEFLLNTKGRLHVIWIQQIVGQEVEILPALPCGGWCCEVVREGWEAGLTSGEGVSRGWCVDSLRCGVGKELQIGFAVEVTEATSQNGASVAEDVIGETDTRSQIVGVACKVLVLVACAQSEGETGKSAPRVLQKSCDSCVFEREIDGAEGLRVCNGLLVGRWRSTRKGIGAEGSSADVP